MDKIWYRNPSKSEVICRCGGDEKNRMTTQNRQKSNAKKPQRKQWYSCWNVTDVGLIVMVYVYDSEKLYYVCMIHV